MRSSIIRPLYHKGDIEQIASNFSIRQDLVSFIEKCYIGRIDIDLNKVVEDRINHIIRRDDKQSTYFPNILADSDDPFFRNQTGMRGIQKQLVLVLDPRDETRINVRRQ